MIEVQGKGAMEFWKGSDVSTSMKYNEKHLHPDLFNCPKMKDTGPSPEWELTDIETCESYNQDNGCPYMAECGIYQNRKKVERLQNLAQKEGVQNENPP